jgi:hypothetical protein
MKLEAVWILINLAYGGEDEVMHMIKFEADGFSFKSVIS